MDPRVYQEHVDTIRRRHRQKSDANYKKYVDTRKGLQDEYNAQMAALEAKRKPPGDDKSGGV